jgi:HlyD family secretion protein
VTVGDELARLDQSELTARRAAATAQLSASRAGLTELRAGTRDEEIGQARAAERAARRRLSDAQRELDRSRRLFEGGAISQQMLDNRQTALEIAAADHEQATERLRMLEAGPRRERIDAQAATVRHAEATVAQIDATLDNTKIVAPFDGIVTVRHREPGEIVAAGTPVLTVMNPAERWVRIYLRQDVVGRVSLGDTVTITADSYPERTYRGRVSYISSEAEFTPRNVQTTEERVKLVFEVWVGITEDPSFDLKPGLAADVHMHDQNPG